MFKRITKDMSSTKGISNLEQIIMGRSIEFFCLMIIFGCRSAMQYVSMYISLLKHDTQTIFNSLIHDASFSIAISILLWVQLVHQAWLLPICILRACRR